MKNAMDIITSRRSTRAYKPTQIDESLLTSIITAGRAAQSGGNEQLTHIIVIQNADILRELIKISKREFAKMPCTEGMYSSLTSTIEHARDADFHFDWLYSAPTLVVLAHQKGHTNAMADSVCVLQNMTIAAEALGVGSCYQNVPHWLDAAAEFREYMYDLGLGRNETITCALTLGYSAEKPRPPLPRTGNPVTYAR
ncbi:MAG: nitroreductase family protein [Defluviitaleaceae bacterium]|nr:nitroreductase family protein [Defluviitaleaceae bacterium]